MSNFQAADVTSFETALLTQEGVVGITGNDLLVQADSPVSMDVTVEAGDCYVLRDAYVNHDNTQKFWHMILTAQTTVTIATADPSNPRIDLICAKIDTGATPGADGSGAASFVVVAGTPGASPSAPAIPDNHLKLAQIAVGTGVTVINAGNITDSRQFIGIGLPYAVGYKLRDTGGTLDGQLYEDSSGNVTLTSAKSGGGIRVNPVSGAVQTRNDHTAAWGSINRKSVSLYVVEGATDTAVADGKAYITIPSSLNGFILKRVHARVITAGTTGTTDIQIHNVTDAVDMLSTKLTIDSAETGSNTAAAPAVINAANDDVATNDELRIDIDAVASTAAKGLIVVLEFEDN